MAPPRFDVLIDAAPAALNLTPNLKLHDVINLVREQAITSGALSAEVRQNGVVAWHMEVQLVEIP